MSDKMLVACLLYHMLTSISLAIAQTCYKTGNFTSNSTYGRNRDLILSSLATNAPANGGFYTASISQDPDRVYALALCRGDTSSVSCFRSVNSAVQDILAEFPVEKEAISWGDGPPCILRYANCSIFGKVEASPVDADANVNDIKSNFTEYNRTWFSLMNRLVEEPLQGLQGLNMPLEKQILHPPIDYMHLCNVLQIYPRVIVIIV